ncbi:expressed unknown protein [Seminavis robusta]|uniref:Uncharacterized protein n=1 Tax=Seminavis robusta TaxID=568900 RepID=A0A9N8DGM1_9STRA|nr:expressed unknown protein [Seminavis robusta]|eukprot:Sro133_g062840.1 n/a (230) ;mRNA; r:6261-6950
MNSSWHTLHLHNLSDLHVLAISRASLTLVQAAYNEDPEALNMDVVEDAFCCGASGEVLQFLVEKKELREIYIHEFMTKSFLSAIPLLQSIPYAVEEVTAKLKELVQTFPGRLYEPNYCSPDPSPLEVVLFSTVFPQDLMEFMIAMLPRIDEFYLRDNNHYDLLVGDEPFQQQMRTSLDDDNSMKNIGSILEKVEELAIDRNDWKASELSQLLCLICHNTNSIKKVAFSC